MDELRRVVEAMSKAAAAAGVAIVTGDTKVVNRRSADKLFVTTAGMGLVPEGVSISVSNARAGDAILISGTIADHGMAVLSKREGLELEGEILSDTQPLHRLVAAMLEAGEVHVLRDPTRGGLGTSLCEIAAGSGIGVEIDSRSISVRDPVQGACELLGIDPLFVANEGKLVAFVGECAGPDAGRDARDSGGARRRADRDGSRQHPGMVVLRTEVGGTRIVDLPFNEQLPRIC